MARRATSGLLAQYAKNAGGASAADYWLKFYNASYGSTTTPQVMYAQQSGGSPITKCKLNTRGEPISNPLDDDSTFIPYVNNDYDAYIFFTEADADANNTVNAIFLGTNVEAEPDFSTRTVAQFGTVAGLVGLTAVDGSTVDFDILTGNGAFNPQVAVVWNNATSKKGAATYTIKTAVQAAADGDVIDGTGAPNYYGVNHAVGDGTYVAIFDDVVANTYQIGCYESLADSGPAITQFLTSLNGPSVLDVHGELAINTTITNSRDITLRFINGAKLQGTPTLLQEVFVSNGYDVVTYDLFVDGGATGIVDVLGSKRAFRCLNAPNYVRCFGKSRVDNPFDWGLSIEATPEAYVENFEANHTYDPSVAGGRDGVHFLNCNKIKVDRARGRSGDDLVSVTIENANDCTDVNIKDVIGSSMIAKVVLVGRETVSTGNYLGTVTIEDVYADAVCRDIVSIEPSTVGNGRLVLKNIGYYEGIASTNHGVLVTGWDGPISATSVSGSSSGQHGVHFTNCGDITATDISGKSVAAGFDGINYSSCGNLTLLAHKADACADYGCEITGCDDVYIAGYDLTNNPTGNLRLVNNGNVILGAGNGVSIPASNSANGLVQAGNTSIYIADGAQFSGTDPFNNATSEFALRRPIYVFRGTDNGTLTAQSQFGGTIVKNSTGNYTVTFSTAAATTNYAVFGNARGGVIDLPAGQGTGGFTFDVKNLSGTNINSANFTLQVLVTNIP